MREYDEKTWFNFYTYIISVCDIIKRDEITHELEKWKCKIKDKDLEHVATAKLLRLKYLVSLDRDFEKFEEYRTPKQFIIELGLKPYQTDY